MADFYWKKFRRQTARARWWKYDKQAAYFVTICTKNREFYFGSIKNRQMELSPAGLLADTLWHEIPRYSKSIGLGPFVVMPNHVHGIIHLKTSANAKEKSVLMQENQDQHLLKPGKNEAMARISPQPGSLPVILRSYKGAVTRHANRLGIPFSWQNRYHDRIIRDSEEYQKLASYIAENPIKWDQDELNTSSCKD